MASQPTASSVAPQTDNASLVSPPLDADADPIRRELRAESVTVRIRWFGLAVGYLLVNAGDLINAADRGTRHAELNAILTLGAVYALVDTWRSMRGHVLLAEYRIAVSAMEALFIGLLCYFDQGVSSPFRFYYFLSLLVCAIRQPGSLTYATLALHAVSFSILAAATVNSGNGDAVTFLLTLVFLGWATWAIISLTGLLKEADRRLISVNLALQQNQATLEQRIMERTIELQESQALLVQQEKQSAFGLLAAGIAHEVGNPLASISSIVQMLNKRTQDDYTTERLEMVDGQLRRIQRILRELVGFSRPANEEVTLVDVHLAIEEALNIAKYYKRRKGKSVNTVFGQGIPTIRTVYDQLVQVVLNLILNALDATDEGASIHVTTSARTSVDDQPAEIYVTIRDEGHGISKEAQQHIFQPYFTTKPTGTGLGLFVCRQLAENELGGTIELVHSDDSGTEFRIVLRSREESPKKNPAEMSAAAESDTEIPEKNDRHADLK